MECGSVVLFTTINSYTEVEVKIKNGNEKIVHRKRKRMTDGIIKREICMELDAKNSAYNIRNKMAVNFVNIKTGVAPFMPTTKQISNLKYRDSIKDCIDKDPIKSLQIMKYTNEYKESIKSIGLDPFYIQYWHPYQETWYDQYSRMEKPKISIDATGGVVHAPLHPDNSRSKHVFLYNVMASPKGSTSRPIGHFLSQNNTSKMIGFLMAEMFGHTFKKPVQVVVDESAALIAACVSTFTTSITTKNYIINCFKALSGHLHKLPECFIRIDVSHYTKNVVNNKCLKSADERVKRLYKCATGLIINCVSPENFIDIVKMVCLLAQSKFLDIANTEEALNKLKQLIAQNGLENENYKKEIEDNSDFSNADSNEIEEIEFDESFSMPFLEEIYNTVEISDDIGKYESIYYNIAFLKHFKKMLMRVPLWSGIMNKFFNEKDCLPPTSAYCESSFKIAKHIIFKNHCLPMRVDKFVENHLNSMEGLLKLTIAENSQQTITMSTVNTSEITSETYAETQDSCKTIGKRSFLYMVYCIACYILNYLFYINY